MAHALGYVKKQENGNFEGTLSGLVLDQKFRISIIPNGDKATPEQPDYRVYTEGRNEIGGGWRKVGKSSGNEYVSLTLAAPAFGPSRVFANLGKAAGQDDDGVMAILWNPRD